MASKYLVVSDRCVFGKAGATVTESKIEKAGGNVAVLVRAGHIAPKPEPVAAAQEGED